MNQALSKTNTSGWWKCNNGWPGWQKSSRKKTEAEKHRLKETHWMHCPKCCQTLATETCGTVEIDGLPQLQGVWLDMGELGAIVEGAGQGSFFNKCLRIIRKDKPASPHLATKPDPILRADGCGGLISFMPVSQLPATTEV